MIVGLDDNFVAGLRKTCLIIIILSILLTQFYSLKINVKAIA